MCRQIFTFLQWKIVTITVSYSLPVNVIENSIEKISIAIFIWLSRVSFDTKIYSVNL